MQYCVYAHALSCTEHMSRKRIWSLKWQTKTKKKKLAIYRAWPWISNCWKWDSNSGLSGIESSALTTRPGRLGANLRRDATSRLLFLDQSVLADFDPRKKNPHFKTRSLSGTSNYNSRRKNASISCCPREEAVWLIRVLACQVARTSNSSLAQLDEVEVVTDFRNNNMAILVLA